MIEHRRLYLFTVLRDGRPIALAEARDAEKACEIAAGFVEPSGRASLRTRPPTEGERYRWAVERSDIGPGSEVALAAIVV